DSGPRHSREDLLAGIWADVLRLERVGIHDNFFELGGDSIISIQIVARANALGLRLTPRQAFQHQTIAELAAAAEAAQPAAGQELLTGASALLPLQKRVFESETAYTHHWNQAVMLRLKRQMKSEHVEAAVRAVVAHHDGLRMRFHQSAAGWEARIAEPDARPLVETVALNSVVGYREAIEEKAAAAQ